MKISATMKTTFAMLFLLLAAGVQAAAPAMVPYAPPNMLSAQELRACVQSEDELDQRRTLLMQEMQSSKSSTELTARLAKMQADRRAFTTQCRTRPFMLANWQAEKARNRLAQKTPAKSKNLAVN